MSTDIVKTKWTLEGKECWKVGSLGESDATYTFSDGSWIEVKYGPERWDGERPPLSLGVSLGFEPSVIFGETWGGGGLHSVGIYKKNNAGEWVEVEGEEYERLLRKRYNEEWVEAYLEQIA
jgi:hypothetical protein